MERRRRDHVSSVSEKENLEVREVKSTHLDEQNSHIAVSYTHLDVYKRQVETDTLNEATITTGAGISHHQIVEGALFRTTAGEPNNYHRINSKFRKSVRL